MFNLVNQLFNDMIAQNRVDQSSTLDMECLWFCFSGLLQDTLDNIKEQWNTHYIRGSRHDTIKGRPDSLYLISNCMGHCLIMCYLFRNVRCTMHVPRSFREMKVTTTRNTSNM